MKKTILIFILSLNFYSSYSQRIEILGMDVDQFLSLSKLNRQPVDIRYYNGEIIELNTCHFDQLALEIRKKLNLCKIYLVSNKKINSVITRFENASIDEIEKLYSIRYKKIENYYFTNDFDFYTTLKLPIDGYPTAQLFKFQEKAFSKDILVKLEKLKLTESIKNQENEKKEKELEALRNKRYIIENDFPDEYKRMYESLQSKIFTLIGCLSYLDDKSYINRNFNKNNIINMYGSYFDLISNGEPFCFNLTLNMSLSKERDQIFRDNVTDNNYTYLENEKDIKKSRYTDLDYVIRELQYMRVDLPNIEENGISILTQANIKLDINYLKYACDVKIKKDKLLFRKNSEPKSEEILAKIKKQIKDNNLDGKHYILYEIINVGDKEESYLYFLN